MEGTLDDNKLVALLLQEKLINKRQAKEVMAERDKTHRPMDQILVEMNIVTPTRLSEFQAQIMGMEHVRITDYRLEDSLLRLFPKKYAIKHRAIPLEIENNKLVIGMEHPQDVMALDDIKMITGMEIRPVICNSNDIDAGLNQYPLDEDYGVAPKPPVSSSQHALEFVLFMILLITPLLTLLAIAHYNYSLVRWMSGSYEGDLTNILVVLLVWGFYAIIIYYIYERFFNKPLLKETPSETID